MPQVLIVDDKFENLYLLNALLAGNGYTVMQGRDGSEALDIARSTPPDLIVSDLLMPVMDGYTLLRHWKADQRLRSIPFVVYTATYTDPKDERLALDLGADAFIVKPAEPEPFMAQIRQVLGSSFSQRQPLREPQIDVDDVLRDYSEALIRKLEDKALELEQANRELRKEIEERQVAEAALRVSEDRYRNLFHSIRDPLMVYDLETLKYVDVNDAAIARYGYSRAEFLEMSVRDIRPEEDVPLLIKSIEETGSEVEHRGIWRHQKKNGELLEAEIFTWDLDFSGRPARVVEARDVTEQRRVATEVTRTTELLQAVADGTPDALFVKDLDCRYLLFNKAASRYVGRPVEEVLGKDDAQLFGPEDAEMLRENDLQVMRSNQIQNLEELLITPEGPRTFHAIKVPYRDREGKVIGLIGISRDITENKNAIAALHLRDRAIQAVSQGILISDATQPDNPIIFVSPGFETITGYTAREVIGRNCRFLQGVDTNDETVAELREVVAEGRQGSVEILNYRKDGKPFWNHLTISPVLDESGKLTHFVGIQTDVTQRRHLEEQFRQSQKLEAFGQLAGGVAHDFNNLITIISGYGDLLMAMLPEETKSWEFARIICDAGDRAMSLTRQMLAFSRKTVLAPVVLEINKAVSEMDKMLQRLLGEDVELTTSLRSRAGLIKVDPGHLTQVLMNLAVNARDAMPRGGKLTISTDRVTLDENSKTLYFPPRPGEFVMLSVSDTGTGMSPEVKSRVFEPFFTTKDVGAGTGLGLAVVHGILEQSGGNLEVESELGGGTTFRLYFPAVQGEVAKSSLARQQMAVRGTESILLVEDDEGVRKLAQMALTSYQYNVIAVDSGSEALRIAEQTEQGFDLLLTDVVMPQIGGGELAARLQAKFPRMKTLFISGYTDDAMLRHGILQDEVAFLSKPFTPLVLVSKVREVLDQ